MRKTFRLLLWVFFYSSILLLLLAGLVQTQPVQNWLIDRITGYLTQKTEFQTSIDHIQINWWDALTIKNFHVKDQRDSTLIFVEEAFVDFELSAVLRPKAPALSEVSLDHARLNMITHAGDSMMNINRWIKALNKLLAPGESSSGSQFSIGTIQIKNSALQLINQNASPIDRGLDYNRLQFDSLSIEAEDFLQADKSIQISILQASAREVNSQLHIRELRSDFSYTPTFMEFAQLHLATDQSLIRDFIRLDYQTPAAMSNFIQDVRILAHMDESSISLSELRLFAPALPDIDDQIRLTGNVTGPVSEISSDEFLFRIGKKTELFGTFLLDGLPDIQETYLNLSLKNSTIDTRDLSPYLSPASAREVRKFGTIRLNADFAGLPNRFTTFGTFLTSIGTIDGRVNFDKKGTLNTLVSRVEIQNLELGKIIDKPALFQQVSLDGNVNVEGHNLSDMLVDLNASVSNLGLLGYNYSNIETDATYGLDLFEGNLRIRDPNLSFSSHGMVNLKANEEAINLNLQLDSANLQALNFIDRPARVKGTFEIDTKGINIDKLTGVMRFNNVELDYEDRNLRVGGFNFQSLFAGGSRIMSLNSDYLVGKASGNFEVNQIVKDLPLLLEQYLAILFQQEPPQADLEENFNKPYTVDLNINLIDINPLLELVKPGLAISKNTQVEGAFYQTEENTVFNFFTSLDTLTYKENTAHSVNIDFNTSKFINKSDILASFYVFSKHQTIGGKLDFSNFGFESIWNNDALNLTFALNQDSTASRARVKARAAFAPQETKIKILPSELTVLANQWEFDPKNEIRIVPKAVEFENLRIQSGNQEIDIEGVLGKAAENEWVMTLNEVNANILNTLTPREYEGKVDGTVTVHYENEENLILQSTLAIRDFEINQILIGNLEAQANLNDNDLDVKLENYLDGNKNIDLSGKLELKNLEFDLTGELREAQLAIFQPFLSNYLSDMSGSVTGDIQLLGNAINPQILGRGKINKGRLKVNYLQTTYQLDGDIVFSPGSVQFERLVAKDVRGNTANLFGGLTYRDIGDILLNINARINNFQVLNTTEKDNASFFGTVYASGNLELSGTKDNLVVDATAKSEPDTELYIPLSSSNDQISEDFIHLINIRDSTSVREFEEELTRLDIQNIQMNFALDVTPDAYTEIIIDPRTQEKISGRGKGRLTMNINNQGNFLLNGTYEITEATYNFSLYNLLKKEFNITPGGRISWYGDPYQGVLDLRATYEELVSVKPLLTPSGGIEDDQNPVASQRFPVRVIMDLNGEIMSPEINFGFDFSNFPNSGDIQTAISSFQARTSSDEQEMNRQVFSVIMTRSFSPEGQFAGVNSLSNSLGQLLSAQLNSFLGQVDQNLEINVDLAALDQNALESFQLSVAYTFLDGRLRVSRDGGFTNNTGQADAASIIGDWQAEYLLTDDGVYRMRIFNRNNFNTFTSLSLSRNVSTYGVALSQNISFNSFSELFRKITQKKIKKSNTLIEDSDNYLRLDQDWKPIDLEPIEQKLDSSLYSSIHILRSPKRKEYIPIHLAYPAMDHAPDRP